MEERIKVHDKYFKPFISNEKLISSFDMLAERINADYSDSEEAPVALCVLNGAMLFTSSMLTRLHFNIELMSIKMTSYQGTSSTGEMKIPMGLTGDVKGRRIIVFEDIIDTGNTMVALKQILLEKGAADVRICAMLLKPEVFNGKVSIDYVGMEIPNDFIVGYGLDYNEFGRNLNDIYVIDNQ